MKLCQAPLLSVEERLGKSSHVLRQHDEREAKQGALRGRHIRRDVPVSPLVGGPGRSVGGIRYARRTFSLA